VVAVLKGIALSGIIRRFGRGAGRLRVELTQSVRASGEVGSILSQTYRLLNPASLPVPVTVVRHLDGDPLFDGTLVDGGAATIDGSALYEFDSSDDPAEPSTYVGIVGSFDHRVIPDRWTIQPYEFLTRILEAGGIPEELAGAIALDSDGGRIVDEPYDVTLSQQWDGVVPALGQAVFITDTRFGRLPPVEATEPSVTQFATDRRELVFAEQLGLTTSPPQLVTGRNTGTAPVTVRGVTAQGPAAGDVVLAAGSCARVTLAPGGSCVVSVSFRPTAAGVREALLRSTPLRRCHRL